MGKRRRTSGGEGGDTSEGISCAQSGAWTQQHVDVGAVEEETWAFDLAHQTTRMRPAQPFGRCPATNITLYLTNNDGAHVFSFGKISSLILYKMCMILQTSKISYGILPPSRYVKLILSYKPPNSELLFLYSGSMSFELFSHPPLI